MANGKSCIVIEEGTLKDFYNEAKGAVRSFSFMPRNQKPKAPATTGYIMPTAGVGSDRDRPETVELAKLIGSFGGNDPEFPSDTAHDVISTIMRGIMLGSQVSLQYVRASGLEQLKLDNDRRLLASGKQAEFSSKIKTAAAIKIFVMAYYIASKLASGGKNEGAIKNLAPDIPTIDLMNGLQATNCILFFYSKLLADPAQTRSEQDITANTVAYFRQVTEEIRQIANSLEFCEPFTSVKYKLEIENFIISGFETNFVGNGRMIEFKKLTYDEVVGNSIGKHCSRRVVERLACMKLDEGRNVMFDLGLVPSFRLGYGTTGTGKTQLLNAIITDLQQHCELLGLPLAILPMPNLVSELQGKSGAQANEYFDQLFNHSVIAYGFADDADSKFIDRTSQRASEGSNLVVETTLTRTEGVQARWDGGRIFDLMSNNPDVMDPAILSRIVSKFPINGAQTVADYLDFDYLAQRHIKRIDPDFIQLADPPDFVFLAAQAKLKSLSDAYADYREPKEQAIRDIVETVSKRFELDSQMFFAQLFREAQTRFPLFNLRDLRNINSAINERLGDFDFPDEWKEKPESFYRQSYDRQKEMVIELMRSNMKGLSFAQIRYQEAIRYLDGFVDIIERVERREIDDMAKQIRRQHKASELAARNGN